jgi:hypothetical protein
MTDQGGSWWQMDKVGVLLAMLAKLWFWLTSDKTSLGRLVVILT